MDDLISRQAALEMLNDNELERQADDVFDGDLHRYKRAAQRIIAQLPSIEPKPSHDWNGWENGCGRTYDFAPKKGKWIAVFIEYTDGTTGSRCECPFCKEQQLTWTNYCPNCGARMTE